MINKALDILNKYYGYDSFRKGQEKIISEILNKNDVVAIMPTGGGKSICYQVPALLLDGLTIVISPLISLMKDQVDSIIKMGINAAYINSSLSNNEIERILDEINNNNIKILYVAPERLESSQFLTLMSDINISQIAVDEAHCVSQWGHDFRTSYRHIKKFIEILHNRPIVTAFTATATEEVREDIVKLLGVHNPRIFISGFDRENLKLNILKGVNKKEYILNYIKENSEQSGIIYAATRKEVDSLYELLSSKGYSVGRYHAGLSDSERIQMQENFVYDKVNIMIATNAFGMGIDKPNIRYVIHYNITKNIEAYYQEIGRAGRDGEDSECILLFSPSDIQTQKYLIDIGLNNELRKSNEYKKLQNMVDFVYSNSCYKTFILNYFGEIDVHNCNNCSNCNLDGELIDKTLDAKKVLSCIYRMKKPYGVNMLIDVLRGSQNNKVKNFGLHTISTYGLMKEYSKDDLKNFINTLISHRYIDFLEGDYPVVKLNESSIRILKDEDKVMFKEIRRVEKLIVNNDLFDILREIRREIASNEGVPPYFIFGDTSLKEMSTRYPTDIKEFMDISGVGELKADKYGEMFIEKIKDYVDMNSIDVNWIFKKSEKNETKREEKQKNVNKEKSYEVTVNMLKDNLSIFEVSNKRNLTITTVFSHIVDFCKDGSKIDFNIDYGNLFDEDMEEAVLDVVKETGYSKLKPIKDKLSTDISYDQIKGIVLKNFYNE